MTGSTESASPPRTSAAAQADQVLIVAVNWLGDAIMSMPAIQCFRRDHPDAKITVLTKPGLKALWGMHRAPDEIVCIKPGNRGVFETAEELRNQTFDAAYILPNSFRSALIPKLAQIPRRVGVNGQLRSLLLNAGMDFPEPLSDQHQSYESAAILGVNDDPLPLPELHPPTETRRHINVHRSEHSALIGLIPGAARGPSKRWPEAHFTDIAHRITHDRKGTVVLMGTKDDQATCERIEAVCEGRAINLSGRTQLPEFTTVLKNLHAVVANDSGGMHLAAAVGTPVVAIFGATDPKKTGPLGAQCTILQKSNEADRDRKIAAHSESAVAALAAVTPDEVYSHLTELTP